jgi:hypothetical protein
MFALSQSKSELSMVSPTFQAIALFEQSMVLESLPVLSEVALGSSLSS